MKLKPLGDRVIVKVIEPEEVTKGGIILPDVAKEKPQVGEILAVGPGRTSDKGEIIKMQVKVGDRVLFGKYSGTEISYEGEKYLIMHESDILAIQG
jgi:Co-chaperonin GroES (HSP10)